MRVLKAVMVEGQAILDSPAADEIVAALNAGDLVVYPTDTLYGIAADPANPEALAKLLAAKKRPRGDPMAVVVADLDAARAWAVIPDDAEAKLRPFLPGALTMLFRPTAGAPPRLVSADGTVGVRVPDHAVALLIAKRFGPVTATSANVHGQPAPVECAEAQRQLGEAVSLYVDAGPCPVGAASTVIDFTGAAPRVIREGAVPTDRLGFIG